VRSAWLSRLFWAGVALLVASWAVWQFSDAHLLSWVLFCGSFPLILEPRAWQDYARIFSRRYIVDEVEQKAILELAFDFKSAIARFVLLYLWLFGILMALQMKVFPGDGWTVVIIVGPALIWVALAFQNHGRSIERFAVKRGIVRRWGRPLP
jgi:hypothetical protein